MVTVSVVIPVYNAARFLADTLTSVVGQTYTDYEVLLVDDGSTDDSGVICQRYARTYPDRIRLLRKPNGGPASARNLGIRMAKGQYIAFLDADDLWLPRKLEKQVAYLEAQPADVGLVYTRAVKFDDEGVWKLPVCYQKPAVAGWVYWDLLRCNPIPSPSALVRKICFDRVGYFDESLDIIEDHDMWSRIAKVYRIALLDEILCLYREHHGGRSKGEEVTLQREIGVMRKHLQMATGQPDATAYIQSLLAARLYDLGWYYLREGHKRAARDALRESLRTRWQAKTALVGMSTYLPYPVLSGGNWLHKLIRRPPQIEKEWAELQCLLTTIRQAGEKEPVRIAQEHG